MGNPCSCEESWKSAGKPEQIAKALLRALPHLGGQLLSVASSSALCERVATTSKFLLFSLITQDYAPGILSPNSRPLHYRAGFVKESSLGWWSQAGGFLEILRRPFRPTFWSRIWCFAGWLLAPHSTLSYLEENSAVTTSPQRACF